MSQEMGDIAGQNDSSDASNGGNPIRVVEVEVPQKGKRARRASTKPERVSKVPHIPGRRSSIYRGVTRHRWTGRYEAHLWDKSCWNQTQNKKGRQVYLGAYDEEEAAARAYDLAALKYWGPVTVINFPLPDYTRELEEMGKVTKEEYLASLRRKSSGFSRGVSKYRGVARHHHNGRWEARIGRIFGNKYLYLGTYSTQEEAAAAYDLAAIEYRGLNAVTNFDLSRYIHWLRPGQDNKIAANPSASSKTGMTSVSTSHAQYDSILPEAPSMEAADSQIEQTGMWDVTQSIASGHHQLSSSSAQSTNSPGSALGLLSQSSVFRKMLNKANLTEYGVTDSNQIDNNNKIVVERNANLDGDVKCELRFQAEAEHVFNHPEMNLLDQPEDMSFGASSVLDRMFYPSDMSFEYMPINAYAGATQVEMDQEDVLSESVIPPLTALSSPYTINTISCSEQLRVGHTLSQRTTLEI